MSTINKPFVSQLKLLHSVEKIVCCVDWSNLLNCQFWSQCRPNSLTSFSGVWSISDHISCDSCFLFSLIASPPSPASRLRAPLYVPVCWSSIYLCLMLSCQLFKLFDLFFSGMNRVLCTMTCMGIKRLHPAPPRKTCWSVYSFQCCCCCCSLKHGGTVV